VPQPVIPVPPPRPIAKPGTELPPPGVFPRPVQNVFEAQLALARQGISSGSLDGRLGLQTRAALRAFQQKERLPVTGGLDPATKERLLLATAPYATYTVTTNDLARLQPLSHTWLGKSQQTALDYETILELVAEKSHSHPNLIRQLNPSVDWTNVAAGTILQVPDVAYADADAKAAFATISLAGKVLEAFDAKTNLLVQFPCSIARQVEKRPIGELHVAVIAPNPNYTFDPDVFPESAEAKQLKNKLVLPPGPNNPVGVAWIGLDKPGYGIHGTPSPEQVGRTESHGCFRLANWNAEYLVKLVWVGMPVYVEP
jgi:lipoprotein-anchoring transpeptidase ErfK/SrfK